MVRHEQRRFNRHPTVHRERRRRHVETSFVNGPRRASLCWLPGEGGSSHNRSTSRRRPLLNPFGLSDDEYPNAVLKAAFDDVDLFGVYLPGQDRKRPHLRYLIATAQRYNESGAAALCIGDFNSGRNETDIEINVRSGLLRDEFGTADLYAELETVWTEAWAYFHPGEFEYSWYPFRKDPDYVSRGGWRIDKAFASPAALARMTGAEYDHLFRQDRLTDHSAIVVDV